MQEVGNESIVGKDPNEKPGLPDEQGPKREDKNPNQEGAGSSSPEPEKEVSPIEANRKERKELLEHYKDLISRASPTEKPGLRQKYLEEDAQLEKRVEELAKQEKPTSAEDVVVARWSGHLDRAIREYTEFASKDFASRDPKIVAGDIRQQIERERRYFTLSADEKRRFNNPEEGVRQWTDYAVQRIIEKLQELGRVDKPKEVEK